MYRQHFIAVGMKACVSKMATSQEMKKHKFFLKYIQCVIKVHCKNKTEPNLFIGLIFAKYTDQHKD